MATNVQRWAMICEGMLGKPATAAQMQRAGTAIAERTIGLELYTPMTNEQKARVAVNYVLQHIVGMVKESDVRTAANAAGTGVATEFAEAP